MSFSKKVSLRRLTDFLRYLKDSKTPKLGITVLGRI